MGYKCNHCKQEISTDKVGDSWWAIRATESATFHIECWPQVENEYRLKSYEGEIQSVEKWTKDTEYSRGGKGHRYNWNTQQWVSGVGFDFAKKQWVDEDGNIVDLGKPPSNNDDRERERERERAKMETIMFYGLV
jgi:hypothetical protein